MTGFSCCGSGCPTVKCHSAQSGAESQNLHPAALTFVQNAFAICRRFCDCAQNDRFLLLREWVSHSEMLSATLHRYGCPMGCVVQWVWHGMSRCWVGGCAAGVRGRKPSPKPAGMHLRRPLHTPRPSSDGSKPRTDPNQQVLQPLCRSGCPMDGENGWVSHVVVCRSGCPMDEKNGWVSHVVVCRSGCPMDGENGWVSHVVVD